MIAVGCVSELTVNGDELPMSDGTTDKFDVVVDGSDSVSSGCDGCPAGISICGAGLICSATGGGKDLSFMFSKFSLIFDI